MNTVLLVYILMANEHMVPDHPKFFTKYPKFFTMYRTEAACTRNAKKYMEMNGKQNFLVNAICADSSNPALVPYLHDVPEVGEIKEVEI